MRIALLLVALLAVAAANACEHENVSVAKQATGDVTYIPERDLWAQEWTFQPLCSGQPMGHVRVAMMRWQGDEQQAADSLEAKAETFALRLASYWCVHEVDWEAKLGRALQELDDDLYAAMERFVIALRGMEEPTTQQIATAWAEAHAPVTWIDATAYGTRLAASFGMTRAELLAWIKEHRPWM